MKGAALLLGALVALVLAGATAAGCTTTPQPPATTDEGHGSGSHAAQPGGPVQASAREAGFELVVRADRPVYRAGEPVALEAHLAPIGRGRSVEVSGSSSLVAFALRELDGSRRMDPVSTADCARRELDGNAPLIVPFTKSGSASSDPANEAFWAEYFADPELRLPAGRWRIEARATFYVGPGCSGRAVAIAVPLDVRVEP